MSKRSSSRKTAIKENKTALEDKVIEITFDILLNDICQDIAFDCHRQMKTESYSLEEIYDTIEHNQIDCIELTPSNDDPPIYCHHCGRSTSIKRYASHLDKCLNNSGRTTTNPSYFDQPDYNISYGSAVVGNTSAIYDVYDDESDNEPKRKKRSNNYDDNFSISSRHSIESSKSKKKSVIGSTTKRRR